MTFLSDIHHCYHPSERKLELSVCYASISGSHAAGNDTPNCPHGSLDSQQVNSFSASV